MRLVSVFTASGLFLAGCFSALAAKPLQQADLAPIGVAAASVQGIERLGLDIYRADRTAWQTTDLLANSGSLSRIPGKAAGWVTSAMDGERKVWRVAYLAETSQGLVSFADGTVDFSADRPLESLRENVPARKLDAAELAQVVVRQKTLQLEWMHCAEKYNYVTIAAQPDGWFVYLLPAQASLRDFPMGGFHRFHYPNDAPMVRYAQTRGCVTQSEDDVPEGATLESLMVTHITSDGPTEMHVFMSLAYGKPVVVATRDGKLWAIEHGHIEEMKRPGSKP